VVCCSKPKGHHRHRAHLGETVPVTSTARRHATGAHHEVNGVEEGLGPGDAERLVDVRPVREIPVGPRRVLALLRYYVDLEGVGEYRLAMVKHIQQGCFF